MVQNLNLSHYPGMTMRVVGDSEGKFYMGSKVVIYCSSDNTISDQMVNFDKNSWNTDTHSAIFGD